MKEINKFSQQHTLNASEVINKPPYINSNFGGGHGGGGHWGGHGGSWGGGGWGYPYWGGYPDLYGGYPSTVIVGSPTSKIFKLKCAVTPPIQPAVSLPAGTQLSGFISGGTITLTYKGVSFNVAPECVESTSGVDGTASSAPDTTLTQTGANTFSDVVNNPFTPQHLLYIGLTIGAVYLIYRWWNNNEKK